MTERIKEDENTTEVGCEACKSFDCNTIKPGSVFAIIRPHNIPIVLPLFLSNDGLSTDSIRCKKGKIITDQELAGDCDSFS